MSDTDMHRQKQSVQALQACDAVGTEHAEIDACRGEVVLFMAEATERTDPHGLSVNIFSHFPLYTAHLLVSLPPWTSGCARGLLIGTDISLTSINPA
jgi:hypothetical protein